MSQDFFEYHIETMKEKYPTFGKYQNYHIFTLLCIKYFFYSESGISFDQDVIEEFLTDGANDGGIDAIFNDPTSEGNDLIIVQSKFYENTALGTDNVAGELYKINETLKKLQSNKISEFVINWLQLIEMQLAKWKIMRIFELYFSHRTNRKIKGNVIN